VAGFEEGADASDGEEITNKIPRIEGGLKEDRTKIEGGLNANRATHEMCLIHADFKHFLGLETKEFELSSQGLVNHVSQGLVNHACGCRASDLRLTSLFKPIRTRLGYGLAYRPGT
jgi:hypothetical protein